MLQPSPHVPPLSSPPNNLPINLYILLKESYEYFVGISVGMILVNSSASLCVCICVRNDMLNFKMRTTNRNPDRCQFKDFSIMTKFIHTLMQSRGKKKTLLNQFFVKYRRARRCGSSTEDAKLCPIKHVQRHLVLRFENFHDI